MIREVTKEGNAAIPAKRGIDPGMPANLHVFLELRAALCIPRQLAGWLNKMVERPRIRCLDDMNRHPLILNGHSSKALLIPTPSLCSQDLKIYDPNASFQSPASNRLSQP